MIDIEARLSELGDVLDVDDADLSAQVLVAVERRDRGHERSGRATRTLAAAAVCVVVVGAVVVAVPSTRDTVAGWFGLDRVRIERRDDEPNTTTRNDPTAITPPSSPPSASSVPDVLHERRVTVDDATVTVGQLDGRLDDAVITKIVGHTDEVVSFQIDGMPALWVEAPHDLVIERDGDLVVERIASSTLLWQDGKILHRVEGFSSVDDAIEFVRNR